MKVFGSLLVIFLESSKGLFGNNQRGEKSWQLIRMFDFIAEGWKGFKQSVRD
jgi:hypothetical protein